MKILRYDLETTSKKVSEAEFRLMGFKSSVTGNEFKWTADVEDAKHIINSHDIIIGWNIDEYDNKIMEKYGIRFYGKIIIDLQKIIHGSGFGKDKGRKSIIMTPKGKLLAKVLPNKKLESCAIALDAQTQKMSDFDYSLFKKQWFHLSKEEQDYCIEYLRHDIEATDYIYQYLEDFFVDVRDGGIEYKGEFKKFMTPEWIRKKKYLTWSVASLVYHMICNLTGMKPRFQEGDKQDYGGGFVALPVEESCKGKIYCFDYNSLYPHIMIMLNLYGRIHFNDGAVKFWKGTGISETTGMYNTKYLSPVSDILREIYGLRLKYKENGDARQYTTKIIINTIYGLLGNPVFASVSDYVAADDCTKIGRQWVREARRHFRDAGYDILYTDTDSVYLRDIFDNEERLMRVKQEHVDKIKSSVPFPVETFDMGVDDYINYMAFFKSSDGRYKKKNYMYVAWDKKTGKYDKLVIKGLPINKADGSKLGKLVFDKYLYQRIIDELNHKFKKSDVSQWILDELSQDLNLAAKNYNVNDPNTYKLTTQVQYQIAKEFGEGNYRMLKLKNPHPKGVGINKNYIRIEDAGDISLGQLDLTKTWNELSPFIQDEQKKLGDYFS